MEIFENTTKNIIDNAILGYNGTILVYGQAGSGKTYTISNDLNDQNLKGIIPRTFEYLFEKIKDILEKEKIKIDINIAFIQIYLETIQDLLCPKNRVKIRESAEKGIFLENCLWINVKNDKECKEAFERGEKNRMVESKEINEYNTRSHTILMIKIEKCYSNEEIEQNVVTKGMLYLVDLAGSERIKPYIKGKQLEQTKKINNSLSVLGNCINSIVLGNSYIPFRESKLTRVLQEALGGNSNTSLIVTLSPSNLNSEESLSSLNFGSRAMKLVINPKRNIESVEENALEKLNKKYIELLEKYNELDLKYKNKENGEKENFEKIIKEYQDKLNEINLSLNEKEEEINILNNELNQLKQTNKVISLQNNELNKKLNLVNNMNKSNQFILEPQIKELLAEQGIEVEEINKNNINPIINQLINNNKEKNEDNNILVKKINILNSSLEELRKNYEEKYNIIEQEKQTVLRNYPVYLEKIDILEKENTKLQTINNINLEKINNIEEEKNQIQSDFKKLKRVETERNKLKNKIQSLNENNKKLSEINSQLKLKNKDIESKYETQIKKYEESKFHRLNNYLNQMENIRLISSLNINEKLLNNSLNIMTNNLELFNKFKKESKAFETIIDNDIPSLTENNYEIVIKKAKKQKNKMSELLNDIDNLNINEKVTNKNYNISEIVEKLNEINHLYNENFINAYNLLTKTFNKVIELCQINMKTREEIRQSYLIKKKEEIKEKIEEKNIKNKILDIFLSNIDKFNPICYATDNSDLKEEFNNLKNESDELEPMEIFNKSIDIFSKIILRSAEFRMHKEKEIKSLNDRIFYFLREIENYKKYYNNHKNSELDEEKRLLNSQLFLQDGEIIRLNQENDKLLKTIENLMNINEEINKDKKNE